MSNLRTIHFVLATVADLELLVSLRIEFLIHNWGQQSDERISILKEKLDPNS